jgi:outer membrane protein, multidrug efflux system
MLTLLKQTTSAVWMSIALTATVVLLETGCTVGPDYHAPKVSVPPQWTAPLSGGETNSHADLAEWWKSFGDEELDSFIATAITSNLTLQVAKARIREARGQRGIVSGKLWPSVGSSGSYSRNRWPDNTFPPLPPDTPNNFNFYNADFDASWEIDVFGGTRRAVEAASADIGAAEFGERDVLVSLLAEVARNYINVRAYQKRLAITRQNIEVQEKILNLTSNRFETELSSDLDVQQATAVLNDTEAEVPFLETGYQESINRLAVLLGQAPGTLEEKMATEKPIPITPPLVPAGLPSDLLKRRPDVQKAERQLAAATARIGAAKADYLPKFFLTGVAGMQSVSASDWFNYGSRYWTIGPTVEWQLFEAGRIRANVEVQNARQEEAWNTYQQTVLTALEDTENALTAYAKEQIRRRSLSRSVNANEKALKLSSQRYESGLSDFLHVLDSERSLYAAQDAQVKSDQTVSLNLVQLYKALGGGWNIESQKAF